MAGGRLAQARRLAPYHLYRTGSALAQSLPRPVARRAGEAAGVVVGRLSTHRRTMITRHLHRICGGDVPPAQIDRAFASYGRYWMEAFRLPAVSVGDLEAAMCYEGIGHIEAARCHGKGVIMAMPHLGAWDWGGAWLSSSGFRLTVVAEELQPAELAAWFAGWRRQLGMTVVPLGPTAGAGVLRALRSGQVVGLLCDRDLTADGIEVDFFGERTRLPAGPATMALRTGAPLLACCVVFEGDHHRAIVLPPLDTARGGKFRDDVRRVTQQMADALASLIRRYPEQWHVFQPNWPSDRL